MRALLFPRIPLFSVTLRRSQLLWIPHFVIPVEVSSRKGPGIMHAFVDALSGSFELFDPSAALEHTPVEGEVLEPILTMHQAAAFARERLQSAILHQRSMGPKPVVVRVRPAQRLYYPFWLHYYERRTGRLDIALVDAVTGVKGGAKTKAGVLEAFRSADRNRAKGARP